MNLLTALANDELYNKLKNVKEFKLYKSDILYREGIIELLKNKNNFDAIIIYEKLPGEISIEELINRIKIINNEIKLFFILENRDKNLIEILLNNNIKNIFYNNEINFDKFVLKIKNINNSENGYLKDEVERLKKIIYEKNKQLNNYKKNKLLIITEIKIKKEFKEKLNKDFKLEFLNINNINKKILYCDKFIFIINSNIEDIKKLIKIINLIKEKYLIKNEQINILFLEKKISIKILKLIFKNYNVLKKLERNKFYGNVINK